MARPVELTGQEYREETFEQKIERLRATPEERARLLATALPFDYEAWVREAGPATIEELAEMEEFLRGREAERQRSLVELTHNHRHYAHVPGLHVITEPDP